MYLDQRGAWAMLMYRRGLGEKSHRSRRACKCPKSVVVGFRFVDSCHLALGVSHESRVLSSFSAFRSLSHPHLERATITTFPLCHTKSNISTWTQSTSSFRPLLDCRCLAHYRFLCPPTPRSQPSQHFSPPTYHPTPTTSFSRLRPVASTQHQPHHSNLSSPTMTVQHFSLYTSAHVYSVEKAVSAPNSAQQAVACPHAKTATATPIK
jgi:hypothetical protein